MNKMIVAAVKMTVGRIRISAPAAHSAQHNNGASPQLLAFEEQPAFFATRLSCDN